MDDVLIMMDEVDEGITHGADALRKVMKAFIVAAGALEEISKNADGPEDQRISKDAIKEIKRQLGG